MSRLKHASELRSAYAAPNDRALRKVISHLDRHCIRFIELSPFCILGSTNADGHADLSPRGGPPGFVKVLDAHTLYLSDRSGNNRLDTLCNVIANPWVALLFMVPGIDETLRIYGSSIVLDDFDVGISTAADQGHKCKTVQKISVDHAYFQCARSVMRARLWQNDAQVNRANFPTLGEILKEQTGNDTPAEIAG